MIERWQKMLAAKMLGDLPVDMREALEVIKYMRLLLDAIDGVNDPAPSKYEDDATRDLNSNNNVVGVNFAKPL